MPPQQLPSLTAEMRALNSKIQVIAQRMAIIEKNEQIIGKTLITHNKTLKEIEVAVSELHDKVESGGAAEGAGELKTMLADFRETLTETEDTLVALGEQARRNMEKLDQLHSELNEMKYILDTINPVAYVTVDQVSDLIDEKLSKLSSSKK